MARSSALPRSYSVAIHVFCVLVGVSLLVFVSVNSYGVPWFTELHGSTWRGGPGQALGALREQRVDIFMRSFIRDIQRGWMRYSLRSIRKNGDRIVNRLILCVPKLDVPPFEDLVLELRMSHMVSVVVCNSTSLGLPVIYDYIHADMHTTTPNVMHMDGDMLLCDLNLGDIQDAEGRPYMAYTEFSKLPKRFELGNSPSMHLVVDNPRHYMLQGGLIFPRSTYSWMRSRLRERYRAPTVLAALRAFVGNRTGLLKTAGWGIDGYAPLGALLFYLHPEAVHLTRPNYDVMINYQFDGRRTKLDGSTNKAQVENLMKCLLR